LARSSTARYGAAPRSYSMKPLLLTGFCTLMGLRGSEQEYVRCGKIRGVIERGRERRKTGGEITRLQASMLLTQTER
jgi:hypothetical protein